VNRARKAPVVKPAKKARPLWIVDYLTPDPWERTERPSNDYHLSISRQGSARLHSGRAWPLEASQSTLCDIIDARSTAARPFRHAVRRAA